MDYLEKAIELVKAQASIRLMTDEEILKSVKNIAEGLKELEAPVEEAVVEEIIDEPITLPSVALMDAKKSIKAKSITCLECGRTMKVLSARHLAHHGLDAVSYREKYGLKKGTPLCSKEFAKDKRERMKNMKLWERRKKVDAE